MLANKQPFSPSVPNELSWIHCNSCYEFFKDQRYSFALLSCYHVLCEKCIWKYVDSDKDHKCVLCQKPAEYQQIDKFLPQKYKQLFYPTTCLNDTSIDILSFQISQRSHLIGALDPTQSGRVKKEIEKLTDEKYKIFKRLNYWIHCNGCFKFFYRREKIFVFLITCHHVLCENCMPECALPNKDYKCALCQSTTHHVVLNEQLELKHKQYFDSLPWTTPSALEVLSFQIAQRTSLFRIVNDVAFLKFIKNDIDKLKVKKEDLIQEIKDQWIHCNKCFELHRLKRKRFSFLSCRHILCEECIREYVLPDKDGKCVLCKKPVSHVVIDDQLEQNYKNYFSLQPWYTPLPIEVLRFQIIQRNSLLLTVNDDDYSNCIRKDIEKLTKKKDEILQNTKDQWIHCNKCYELFHMKQKRFSFLNCRHVLCADCMNKYVFPDKDHKCVVCQKSSISVIIDDKLSPDINQYFSPMPWKTPNAFDVLSFQITQRNSLLAVDDVEYSNYIKKDIEGLAKKRDEIFEEIKMNWIHCNKCFALHHLKQRRFAYLVCCRHVLCEDCMRKYVLPDKDHKCVLCRKPALHVILGDEMKQKFKQYFSPIPWDTPLAIEVLQFQITQRSSLLLAVKDVEYSNYINKDIEELKKKKQEILKNIKDHQWIHCNKCFALYHMKQKRFAYLTSCHHVLCEDCMLKYDKNHKCILCQRPAVHVILGDKMEQKYKQYFSSIPWDTPSAVQVLQFQINQRNSLLPTVNDVEYSNYIKEDIKELMKKTSQLIENKPKTLWIHCNRCFEQYNKKTHVFVLLSCSHVLCKPCLEKCVRKFKGQFICHICSASVTSNEISNKMASRFKDYFLPQPWDNMAGHSLDMISFQVNQRNNLLKGLRGAEKIKTSIEDDIAKLKDKYIELKYMKGELEHKRRYLGITKTQF